MVDAIDHLALSEAQTPSAILTVSTLPRRSGS
jgi:hypothetical protein